MTSLITQSSIPIAPSGGFTGFGPIGNPGDYQDKGVSLFSKFLSSAIGLMTIVAIIWFIFVFIGGAIGIISAGGDKAALETAKKRITSGLIGITVTIIAVFIVRLFGELIGIPNILNFKQLFNALL